MVVVIVAAVTLMKFGMDVVAHPERNPQAMGWIEKGEQLVGVDEARRVMKVRMVATGEVIEIRYEVGGKPPEWVPVPAGWTTKEGWLLRGPDFERGRWTYHLTMGGEAWKKMSRDLKQQGYEHVIEKDVTIVKVLATQLREPARVLTVSGSVGTTMFLARENRAP